MDCVSEGMPHRLPFYRVHHHRLDSRCCAFTIAFARSVDQNFFVSHKVKKK